MAGAQFSHGLGSLMIFFISLQDFTDLSVTSASFIPTVTAISSCPDLRWMVQPVVSSVAPSNGRVHPYSTSAYNTTGMLKTAGGRGSGRRSKVEQVDTSTCIKFSHSPNRKTVRALSDLLNEMQF